VSMPFLTHLTIEFNLGKQSAQMLAAVRLDTLRSLDARMDLCHAWFLQGCTQLKGLTLYTPNVKGVTAIAQLNGLTYLELDSAPRSQLLSAAEQSELGSTLAALTNLQSLRIDHAPPGPVTQALSQLTSLTELTLYQQSLVPNPGPLTLPSCVKLTFCISISMRHLASIQAPKLQHLAGASLALTPSNLDSLRRLCRGVLRACSRLTLYLHHAWSKEDTVALMAVLSQDWQPSAEALQAVTSNSTGLNRDTSGLERKSSNGPPEQQRLELVYAHCSRQCLQLLPEGMGSVYLWWVAGLLANPLVYWSVASACDQSQIPLRLPYILPVCLVSPQALHPGPWQPGTSGSACQLGGASPVLLPWSNRCFTGAAVQHISAGVPAESHRVLLPRLATTRHLHTDASACGCTAWQP
jgi:hypothetical protein